MYTRMYYDLWTIERKKEIMKILKHEHWLEKYGRWKRANRTNFVLSASYHLLPSLNTKFWKMRVSPQNYHLWSQGISKNRGWIHIPLSLMQSSDFWLLWMLSFLIKQFKSSSSTSVPQVVIDTFSVNPNSFFILFCSK